MFGAWNIEEQRLFHTVDGKHFAPPGMYKTLSKDRINYQPQLVCRIPEPATLFLWLFGYYILLIRLFLLYPGDTLGFVPSLYPILPTGVFRVYANITDHQTFLVLKIGGIQGTHRYKLYGYGLLVRQHAPAK